ncbi:TniQ family protein, partial [Robertmurraya massiliosenegalensis]|uniref:TniQ family protein n=1 Tax=Robertmurraya massiliosenegalensis TaxID=1287657 RepID=UPI0003776633
MLLFHLTPKENESLTGFFYRTARENLMDNLSWIEYNFAKFSGYQIRGNSLNWGDLKVVLDVSSFLNINQEDAIKMTFPYLLDFHGLKVDYDTKNKIKCPWFLYQTTKVCSLCVKEDPYHRMDWSFTYSTVCKKHKVFLIDKCPSCDRDINIKSVVNDKCVCEISISSSMIETVNDHNIFEYQREVDKFFFNDTTVKVNNWITNSFDFYNSLEFLATWLPQTLDIDDIISIDGVKYSGNAIARTRLKKSKTLQQACPLYLHSYLILKEWPNKFYDYINLIKNNNKENNKLHIF